MHVCVCVSQSLFFIFPLLRRLFRGALAVVAAAFLSLLLTHG